MTDLEDVFPVPVMRAELVVRWRTAVLDAFKYAKGARLNEIRGVRVTGFDQRGVHLFSEQVGVYRTCELLLALDAQLDADQVDALIEGREDNAGIVLPELLWKAARTHAERDFKGFKAAA